MLNSSSQKPVVRPLHEVVRVVGGGTPSKRNPSYWKGMIPWVSPKDFRGAVITDSMDHISEAAVAETATNLVPGGAVLVVVRSGILRRKVPVAVAGRPVAINQDLKALVPVGDLDSRYLSYFLRASQDLLLRCVKLGATVQSIDVSRFLDIEVPLPDLARQRRIVMRLDELLALAQEAEAQHRAAVREAGVLMPAVLRDAFHSAGSEDWEHVPLGEIARIAGPLVDPRKPANVDLPHISGESIESRTGRLLGFRTAAEDQVISGKYRFPPGAVLYSKIRPYLRKVCRVTFEGLCSADIYPLITDPASLDPDYLLWALLGEEFSAYAVPNSARARMPKLNREQLFSYALPLPPLNRQRELVQVLNSANARIEQLQAAQAASAPQFRRIESAILEATFRSAL